MIVDKNNISDYLQNYYEGNISLGLGTGIHEFDDSLRFKKGQFVIINGLDNVGKTAWILWYFLTLSKQHNLKWCIWSGENKAGQLTRQLIEFYTGKKLKELKHNELFKYELEISKWFTFIDNSKMYKNTELYKIFIDSKCDGCLIDPYTGMDREYTHAANYNFLNETRQFCNETGISLYVNTHPVSEAARRTFPLGEEYAGYPLPPSKSQSEGGQPFANRPDDFITIHRLVGHPTMQYKTLIYIRKIKDVETGGKVTPIDNPLEFDFNKGLGFTFNGINPLSDIVKDDLGLSELNNNYNFDNEDTPF